MTYLLAISRQQSGRPKKKLVQRKSRHSGRITYSPPLTPFFAQRAFFSRGGGRGVFRSPPCGRNFITPSLFNTHPPPPLEGYFQGWGGACRKFAPTGWDSKALPNKLSWWTLHLFYFEKTDVLKTLACRKKYRRRL